MKAVLTWHSIDWSGSVISTSPETFARQLERLAWLRVRVVSIPELVRLPEGQDAVSLTFDDGFANFATEAAPRLADHGFCATVFVVTDRVGRTNDWGGYAEPGIPSLPLLRWPDLGRLAEAGIAIGSHSRSHADLPTLDPAMLIDEVLGSADTIGAELGRRPSAFAYPYGTSSESAIGAVGAHYAWGCTADLRPVDVTDRRELLPRIDMYYFGRPARLEGWGSPLWRRRLALRRALRAPRQRLRTAMRRRRAGRRPAIDETVA